TVAFQSEDMTATRGVGELARGCEHVHGMCASPQQLQDLPARAFEQSLSPPSGVHSKSVRSDVSKSKAVRRAYRLRSRSSAIAGSIFALLRSFRCFFIPPV